MILRSQFSVRRRSRFFDGCADEVAPLGPRAVVVPHILEPEQVLHREPGEAHPLADSAIGDERLLAGDALRRIESLQVVEALEGSILVAVLSPWDAFRAGNVSAALAGFRQSRRRQDFAGELLRAPDVDECGLLAG